jgi:hypothetical protein
VDANLAAGGAVRRERDEQVVPVALGERHLPPQLRRERAGRLIELSLHARGKEISRLAERAQSKTAQERPRNAYRHQSLLL